VCGQRDGDGLRLKGVWPAGLAESTEALYEKTVWLEEDWFLGALGAYRRRGVRPVFPRSFHFAPRHAQRGLPRALSRVIRFPTRHKLRAFLDRAGFFGGLLLLALGLLAWVLTWPAPDPLLLGVLTALALGPLAGLVYVVGKEFRRV